MKLVSKSEAETEALGERIANDLSGGDVIAICGEMGAGKTVFIRGMARGLGFSGSVTSPTYTIVNEYPTNPALFHFDLYRLNSADELYEIGFDDYLARGGICVVEWFENAEEEYNWNIKVIIEQDTQNELYRNIEIIRR